MQCATSARGVEASACPVRRSAHSASSVPRADGPMTPLPVASCSWSVLTSLARSSCAEFLYKVIQYAAKLLVPILEFRARVQHRAGLGAGKPNVKAIAAWQALSSAVGDARMLWRIWGASGHAPRRDSCMHAC